MLQFTTNITNLQQSTRSTHNSSFVSYTSKKQLNTLNTTNLSVEALEAINSISNVFTLAVHKGNAYVVLTMYYSQSKSYAYYVLDLNTNLLAPADSVAEAKKAVLELVAAQ